MRPVSKVKVASVLGGLFGLIIGVGYAALTDNTGRFPHYSLPPVSPGAALIFAVAVFAVHFPMVALHELGHLAAGWFCGAHITMLAIGPLTLRRAGRGWKLVASSGNRSGGFAGVVPKSPDRLREKMIAIIAAGPLTTLLSATIGAVLLWQGKLSGWIAPVIAAFVFLSYLLGISELVVSQGKGMFTDGGRLRMLLRNDERGVRWCATVAIVSSDQQGVRPRDWDPAFVQLLVRSPDRSSDSAAAALLAYSHAAGRKEVPQASDYIDRAMAIVNGSEPMPPLLKTVTLLSAAAFEATHRRNLDIARALWYTATAVPGEPEYLRPAAEAAIFLAEGEQEKAREAAALALRLMPDPPVTGSEKTAVEGLRTILDAASQPVLSRYNSNELA